MKRRQILSSKSLSEDEKNTRLQDLMLRNPLGSGPPLSIEDLGYPPTPRTHTHTHPEPTLVSEGHRCDFPPVLQAELPVLSLLQSPRLLRRGSEAKW